MKNLKLMMTLTLIMSSLTSFAQGGGGKVGGGGDASELTVNEIRVDILKWIAEGGSKKLKFQDGMTSEQYNEQMNRVLQSKKVIIGFVEKDSETDEELQVSVDGSPKTCRGFQSLNTRRLHILCNISRFEKTSEEGQYKLIHHEYAGLAGLESNEGAASDYYLTEQLSQAGFKRNGSVFHETATIKERGTNREIIFSQNKTSMKFTLKQGASLEELSKINFKINDEKLILNGTKSRYSFKLYKNLSRAAGHMLKMCWTRADYDDQFPPALMGLQALFVGVALTLPVCIIMPAAPYIAGIITLPVDAAITASHSVFNPEVIAARKFAKMIKGKSSKASKKAFRILIKEIEQI